MCEFLSGYGAWSFSWADSAAWNSSVAFGSTQTFLIARNMVQDDWQWPSMRNGSPLALYCAMMASNFAIGPPPPQGADDPAASAAGAHISDATSAGSARQKSAAAVAAGIFGMRVNP